MRRTCALLADAGCDRVLGIASVGGLRPHLGPGTYVIPDDFIALDVGPVTSLDTFEAHQVAHFDEDWRREVVDALRGATQVEDGGVYWQVAGPRIETAAEVRLIAQHAHVVGMTVASECVSRLRVGAAVRGAVRGGQPGERRDDAGAHRGGRPQGPSSSIAPSSRPSWLRR